MKKALSWFALVLGVGLSILLLGILGIMVDPSQVPGGGWLIVSGMVALVSLPMAASFLAIRHRRLAAWMFLAPAPILGFFAADIEALALASQYGRGWPGLYAIVLITLLYFICIALAVTGFLARRLLLFILAAIGGAALMRFVYSGLIPSSQQMLSSLALMTAPLVILGLFWLGTHHLAWPPIIPARQRSLAQRIGRASLTSAFILFLIIMATAVAEIPGAPHRINDCGYSRLIEHKGFTQAVFVAKVLRLGNPAEFEGVKGSHWAVASVQEHFWGLPRWFPSYLILSHGIFTSGEIYLIDDQRPAGLISRFLPIFPLSSCPQITPTKWVAMKLRVLRDGPPKTGVWIIGQAYIGPDPEYREFEGTPVVILGPSGSVTTTLDQYGIYDVSSLPPSQYEVRIQIDKQLYRTFGCESPSPELKSGEVWGCDVNILPIRKSK